MRASIGKNESGSVLAVSLLATFVVVGAGVAMLMTSAATARDEQTRIDVTTRRNPAHAAVADSFLNLAQGGNGTVASKTAPVAWRGGAYWATCADNGNGTRTVNGFGRSGGSLRAVRAIVQEIPPSIFFHSMFAGNSSKDPAYVLKFGGTGTSADQVTGDVFSGGSLSRSGDAKVAGILRATGSITGATGITGFKQPVPDLAGRHYDTTADVLVAKEFATSGVSKSSASYGGTAVQVPQENPAHIFRKNPSDRATETVGTTKDDYFLEDPYQTLSASSEIDPVKSAPIVLSGVGGAPGPSGNRKVYYIDGNLWIHNKNAFSFTIRHGDAGGIQVTFVVRGNIYMSDNLLTTNKTKDGIALIALKDPSVADSGNIYFGDPVFGTLEQMDAFMYAENNFHDNNLRGTGSDRIVVNGVMSAGNHVSINRPTSGVRPQLVLNFDTRIRDKNLDLPGVPGADSGPRRPKFRLVTEYEVAPDA